MSALAGIERFPHFVSQYSYKVMVSGWQLFGNSMTSAHYGTCFHPGYLAYKRLNPT